MGAAFISQQYLQNVLGYSTLDAGAAILPAVVFMVLVAPRSAKLVETEAPGSRCCAATCPSCSPSLTMLLLWKEDIPYWQVGLAYMFIGIGVGFAGTPASHSLTGSVPVRRAGMASGTADLQRDLGGAIMQSIFGALLTAGYATAAAAAVAAAPNSEQINESVAEPAHEVVRRRRGRGEQYPQYASQITAAAKQSFLDGDKWAYTAGLVAVLLGALLVSFMFPKRDQEQQDLAGYEAEDSAAHEHRTLSAA